MEVEVDSSFGNTAIVIVGLPDAAVKESRDRVLTAVTNPDSSSRWAARPSTWLLQTRGKKARVSTFPSASGFSRPPEQIEPQRLEDFVPGG